MRTPDGAVLGSVCVLDPVARPAGLTDEQSRLMQGLADQAVALFELRRSAREREAALAEVAASEQRYRELAEHASDIISRHDLQGNTLYVSPAVERVLGRRPQDELGAPGPDRVHPDDRAAFGDALQSVLAGQPTSTVTVRATHAAGGHRWLEVALSAVVGPDAVPVGFHAVARDVTELRAVERERADADSRYAQLVEDMPDAVLVTVEGAIAFANTAAERLLVASAADLVGRHMRELQSPDAPDGERGPVVLGDQPVRTRRHLVAADGRRLVVAVHARPVVWHGRPAVQAVLRDVTVDVAASDALRASEQRLSVIYENSPLALMELSPGGVVLRANDAFARLVGVPPADLVGHSIRDVTSPSGRSEQEAAFAAAVARPGSTVHTERTLVRADGTEVELVGTLTAVAGPDGEVGVLLATAGDVTERNRQARELEALNADLVRARDDTLRRSAFTDTVLDTVDVGIVACDAEGRLTLFNGATRRLHQLPADGDVDPSAWADRYALLDETGTRPLELDEVPLYRALRQGTVTGAVITIRTADGPARLVRCDGRTIVGRGGQVLGAVVAMTDITDERAVAARLAEQAEFTQVLLDTAETAIWACDAAGRPTYVNGSAQRLLEGSEASASPVQEPLRRALAEGAVRDVEVTLAPAGRPRLSLLVSAGPLHDADGGVTGAVAAAHDVSALRRSEQRFRAAFQEGPTPTARLDADGRVLEVNPALRRLLALPGRHVVGRPLVSLCVEEDRELLAEALLQSGSPVEVRLLRVDGSPVWCELACSEVADDDHAGEQLVQLLDVDARKEQELSLEHAARHDALTGLPNRVLLHERVRPMLDPTTGAGVALLFVDLDGFKAVNDTHGHEAGDAVLVEVGVRLLSAVRPEDTVARLGGDEFVVACPLPVGDGDADLAALAGRIEQIVTGPVEHGGRLLACAASVGTVSAPAGADYAGLLDSADRAMYVRKQQRRDGRTAGGRPGSGALRRLSSDLGVAVEQGRMSLAYQPLVRTGDGRGDRLRGAAAAASTRPAAPCRRRSSSRWPRRTGRSPPSAPSPCAPPPPRPRSGRRRLPAGAEFGVGVNVSPLQLLDPGLLRRRPRRPGRDRPGPGRARPGGHRGAAAARHRAGPPAAGRPARPRRPPRGRRLRHRLRQRRLPVELPLRRRQGRPLATPRPSAATVRQPGSPRGVFALAAETGLTVDRGGRRDRAGARSGARARLPRWRRATCSAARRPRRCSPTRCWCPALPLPRSGVPVA